MASAPPSHPATEAATPPGVGPGMHAALAVHPAVSTIEPPIALIATDALPVAGDLPGSGPAAPGTAKLPAVAADLLPVTPHFTPVASGLVTSRRWSRSTRLRLLGGRPERILGLHRGGDTEGEGEGQELREVAHRGTPE